MALHRQSEQELQAFDTAVSQISSKVNKSAQAALPKVEAAATGASQDDDIFEPNCNEISPASPQAVELAAFDPDDHSEVYIYNEGKSRTPPAPCFFPDGASATASGYDTVVVVAHPTPKEDFQTFTCFSRLPTELRAKIYYHALPDPRVLAATINYEEHSSDDWDEELGCSIITAPHCKPNGYNMETIDFQLISKEACVVFHLNYHRIPLIQANLKGVMNQNQREDESDEGGSEDDGSEDEYEHQPFVARHEYFDSKRDTLVIDHSIHYLRSLGLDLDLTSIHHLAIRYGDFAHSSFSNPIDLLNFANACPSLRTLTALQGNLSCTSFRDDHQNFKYHLLEVTNEWNGMHIQNAQTIYHPHSKRRLAGRGCPEIQLGKIQHKAGERRSAIQGILASKKYSGKQFKLKMSVLSKISGLGCGLGCVPRLPEVIPLLPKVPKYHGVCFLTEKPPPEAVPETSPMHILQIANVSCNIPCYYDGMIVPY
ncbi:hypothetical protein IFR05_011513 [Cadophora sp. M221]|nr:hypothetical protein IFR05_011513 [Cadophora sp. M221]